MKNVGCTANTSSSILFTPGAVANLAHNALYKGEAGLPVSAVRNCGKMIPGTPKLFSADLSPVKGPGRSPGACGVGTGGSPCNNNLPRGVTPSGAKALNPSSELISG